MRKSGAILFVMIFCVISAASAQLSNTKWKGFIINNGQVPAVWIFKKTTVDVLSLPDSSVLESMTYKTASGFLFITKVSGTTSCDNSTIGKYSYKIKKDSLYLKSVDDACTERADAVPETPYVKVKK